MGDEATVRLSPAPGDSRAGIWYCGAWAVGSLLLASTSRFVGDHYAVVVLTSGLVLAVIFGAVALLCALSPGPGRVYLDLTTEGFREQAVRTSRTFGWQDFEGFGVVNDSEGGPEVGFRFSDAYQGQRARSVFGFTRRFDGLLYDTYGMSARDLAGLLNDWRLRHGPDSSGRGAVRGN